MIINELKQKEIRAVCSGLFWFVPVFLFVLFVLFVIVCSVCTNIFFSCLFDANCSATTLMFHVKHYKIGAFIGLPPPRGYFDGVFNTFCTIIKLRPRSL